MGDFCVASLSNEATPMTAVESVASSSKNISKSVDNIFHEKNVIKKILKCFSDMKCQKIVLKILRVQVRT